MVDVYDTEVTRSIEMEKQGSFSDIENSGKKKTTRRKKFLQMMEVMVPWEKWVGIIEGVYMLCLLQDKSSGHL